MGPTRKSSLSDGFDPPDIEKNTPTSQRTFSRSTPRSSFSIDDSFSSLDSPEDARASDPMLGHHEPASATSATFRQRGGHHANAAKYISTPSRAGGVIGRFFRVPHRTTRWLAAALTSTLILFALFLVRASYQSARQVEEKAAAPPPPPKWESFEFIYRYYGGLRTLVSQQDNVPEFPREGSDAPEELDYEAALNRTGFPPAKPFYPYPAYDTNEYVARYGPVVECFLDEAGTVKAPWVFTHHGVPAGFPQAVAGSYAALGIRDDQCFDRFGKYGAYGYGYSRTRGGLGAGLDGDREGVQKMYEINGFVDYRQIRWADVTSRCYEKNRHRFVAAEQGEADENEGFESAEPVEQPAEQAADESAKPAVEAPPEQPEEQPADQPAEQPDEAYTGPSAQQADEQPAEQAKQAEEPKAAEAAQKRAASTVVADLDEELKATGSVDSKPPAAEDAGSKPTAAEDTGSKLTAVPSSEQPAATSLHMDLPATEIAEPESPSSSSVVWTSPTQAAEAEPEDDTPEYTVNETLPRTAVIIRTWNTFEYTAETIMNLRSLIVELSILSGGEYDVHFLIHVKDDNLPIWADEDLYQQVLDKSLPEEFHGMGTLWSERAMGLIYGGLEESFFRTLPVHGVYRSAHMPLQWFAHRHPEYEFFWNWEMDVRYTGQYYELFDRISNFAKQQPRKGLWERSARFYVPEVHGTWDDFVHTVRVQTEMRSSTAAKVDNWASKAGPPPGSPDDPRTNPNAAPVENEEPVWGPQAPEGYEPFDASLGLDVEPPTTYSKDKYEWGVGEPADLITLNPLYNPQGTHWLLAQDITGYHPTADPVDNSTGVTESQQGPAPRLLPRNPLPPRRAASMTTARFSRRLLDAMHRETALRRHSMFTEMFPASVALHHGLKAVYAPHPLWVDRQWPTAYWEATFNAGPRGQSGGGRASVFGEREQHNFFGTSFFYNAAFPLHFWKRWLGFKLGGAGGEEQERAGEGRMCVPPVLLHPCKEVHFVIEDGE